MSQEYNGTARKSRRGARAQRHRPVLVTAQETEESQQGLLEAENTQSAQMVEVASESVAEPRARRRFGGFFSTVGKSEAASTKEADVAQARLARATSGKATGKGADASERTKAEVAKAVTASKASSAAQRPASGFKTRYIIGMAVYLLSATYIGNFEATFMKSIGADQLLTQFNLFGGMVRITTSTLVFLATLVVVLVVLARLDLIPRSLGAAMGPANRPGQASGKTSQNNTSGVKVAPPSMKQGIQGAHDDLYQQYRSGQRKKK